MSLENGTLKRFFKRKLKRKLKRFFNAIELPPSTSDFHFAKFQNKTTGGWIRVEKQTLSVQWWRRRMERVVAAHTPPNMIV